MLFRALSLVATCFIFGAALAVAAASANADAVADAIASAAASDVAGADAVNADAVADAIASAAASDVAGADAVDADAVADAIASAAASDVAGADAVADAVASAAASDVAGADAVGADAVADAVASDAVDASDEPEVDPAKERPDDDAYIEEMTIVGSREAARDITGAAHYIGPEQLARFAYADVQRIVREVPGVSVQVEDGYGLRPNLSIRGVATERSGRITLLEDGILIAPAPYSAPSAYYFPTAGRMHSFEVLKGPASITQGPYTIGGAFNMVSTPIPATSKGQITAETGQFATHRLHAAYGRTQGNFGFLVETHQWLSDGFQEVDRGGEAGLNVRDYTVKLSLASNDRRHRVELKLQAAEQTSNQSYLGLTDADFARAAMRRYGVSMLDEIHTEHEQAIVRYEFDVTGQAMLRVIAYNNTHARDWFKTEGLDPDGSEDAWGLARTSWAGVVSAINRGAGIAGLGVDDLRDILHGDLDTPRNSIELRSNNREYFSRGVQLSWDQVFSLGDTVHRLDIGVRAHEDQEDRLQRNSGYHQEDGKLVLDDVGLLGNAGNRIQSAEALSLHIHDRITIDRWTFTPGLRFEDIDQARVRYETRKGRTDDPKARTQDNLRDTRSNATRVVLPGLGVLYAMNDSVSLLAGVHKGFTAPSNAPDVEEETALNFEFGVRMTGAGGNLEVIGFVSDYDNLLGECTSSSGTDCEAGDAFNGDAATVRGVELAASTRLALGAGIDAPLAFAYTFIDGSFDTDIADTDFFGDVSAGDPLPYIPEHQFTASAGLVAKAWQADLSLNYVGAVCVRASCGAFEKTDASLTIDAAARWMLSDRWSALLRLENLTDAQDIVGRHPYGARPNRSRTASLGIRFAF